MKYPVSNISQHRLPETWISSICGGNAVSVDQIIKGRRCARNNTVARMRTAGLIMTRAWPDALVSKGYGDLTDV